MRIGREQILGCGLVIQLTTTLVVAILLPLGLGLYLDRLLQTSPMITFVMMVFGITLGTVAVYRAVAREYERVGGNKS